MKKLRFAIKINSPEEKVWKTMLEPESYRKWTEAFTEGSYYEGSWQKGAKIRFLCQARAEPLTHTAIMALSAPGRTASLHP